MYDSQPRHPQGTAEYDAYLTELRAELRKFADGEPPYAYDGWEIVTHAAERVSREGVGNTLAHGEIAAAIEAMQLGDEERAVGAARCALGYLDPPVQLGNLDNGLVVERIKNMCWAAGDTEAYVISEIQRATGCTYQGAVELFYAPSVASLADRES